MPPSPIGPHVGTPAELKERIEAERAGEPFLVYRDGQGRQRLAFLIEAAGLVTIGREHQVGIALDWDPHVSALHAELRAVGSQWLIVDDGLSRNGTYVNGERVAGRRRLRDRDEIRIGSTVLVFRRPRPRHAQSTAIAADWGTTPELSPAQRRVLVALCRPFGEGDAFARPATNQQIAEELHLTVAAVKTHLRILFQRFGLDELAQNEKRVELARRAFETGALSSGELGR
jgi:DNA-binding CsgD family transcriptional regulator